MRRLGTMPAREGERELEKEKGASSKEHLACMPGDWGPCLVEDCSNLSAGVRTAVWLRAG